MGWFNSDHPGHEGYLVGLVELELHKGSHIYRELTIDDTGERALQYVAVSCDCGWRSQRLWAPFGTIWTPHTVSLAADRDTCVIEAYEESARQLWSAHVRGARDDEPWLRCDPVALSAAIDRAARRVP